MRAVRMTLDEAAPREAREASAPHTPIVRLHSAADVHLEPFERTLIPTGAYVALPHGCGGFVVAEPGYAAQTGLTLANAPGLVDEGYRGEVGIIAVNLDACVPIEVKRGDHIANMLVMQTADCAVVLDGGDEAMARGATLHVRVIDEVAGEPSYAHDTDNGIDLRCAEAFRLEPFERRAVRLGIAVELSEGLVAQVQPRSGMALKQGLSVVGSPFALANPTLDEELVVPFVNLDQNETIEVEAGTRVAQLVVFQADAVSVELVDSLDETERGSGGFGSTGQ